MSEFSNMSAAELRNHRARLVGAIESLNEKYGGRRFDDEGRAAWNRLNQERDDLDELIPETETREARILELGARSGHTEAGAMFDHGFRTADATQPHLVGAREVGLRTVERYRSELSSEAGDRLDGLVRDPRYAYEARYLAAVGDPAYNRAFGKLLADPVMGHNRFTPEESSAVQRVTALDGEARAMGTGTGPTGGFAIPFTLDPSVMLSSNGVLNPIRAISRAFPIATKEWKGVSSDGVTAAYVGEAVEATDASPTLAQPVITTVQGRAFIPFSIELGEDWAGLQEELARLIADGKDVLESGATGFLSGTGATNNQQVGLLAIGTAGSLTTTQRVQTDVAATLDIDDVWDIAGQVRNTRFGAAATFVGQGGMLDRIYRMTPAGSTTEPQAMVTREGPLAGFPKAEWSSMANATTTGTKVLLLGDFSNYLIADRVGLSAELIPHLFGATNRYPTGQRGVYAYWRTGTVVAVANAFRYLEVL